MKNKIVLFLLLTLGVKSFAQEVRKTLYPIYIKKTFLGVKFIYDRQLIDDASILQIPMLQAQDPKVSVEFLTYLQQQKVVKFIKIIPAGLSLYTIFNRDKVSSGFYWTTVGTTLLISTYLNIKSNTHLSKAINRYNEVISSNQIGLNVQTTADKQAILGIGLVHNF
jgi:hypothetical protein